MTFTMDYRAVYERILSDWFDIQDNRFLKYKNNDLEEFLRHEEIEKLLC